jgi:NADH-quinone oxidoreductase subunit N
MLSLGGIPPTAGFMGKVYVFSVAVEAGQIPLVIVGVLNSALSIYYYLRVTVAMYMREPQGEPVEVAWGVPAVLATFATLFLTLWWGIQASGLLEQAQRSIMALL